MSEKKRSRRRWTSLEKMRIVLLATERGAEASEVCRREGLGPTQYYAWKNQLLSGAEAVFGGAKTNPRTNEKRDWKPN